MRARILISAVILCAALAAGPVVALASGPSAGNNQYTDPIGSSPPPATHTTTSSPPSPPPTSTPTATSAPAPASTAASSTPTPTATTASSADPTTSTRSLPHTGYDGWLAAGLGAAFVAIGTLVRRRVAARDH